MTRDRGQGTSDMGQRARSLRTTMTAERRTNDESQRPPLMDVSATADGDDDDDGENDNDNENP